MVKRTFCRGQNLSGGFPPDPFRISGIQGSSERSRPTEIALSTSDWAHRMCSQTVTRLHRTRPCLRRPAAHLAFISANARQARSPSLAVSCPLLVSHHRNCQDDDGGGISCT
ncbi:hypothetical protein HPB50_005874 [Hyalomma asiaticum]|uniref:Uncharacterized protein n=1 Tax=Hyalomma asiaticum TaxID=266040 RepID=A0ACB7S6T4_HYAAI|nr:hypothetical protein HPB50_005874 [Hyalomma asiaticum]